ncbi:hypothetical protein DPMN_126506 [Dreissena polymorpha]|uniref:Uncharacterized protein n=1 Tax=Dreissena polymorpha TaxID=45954 RepID=A0A9D4GX69_DREPO|nr:hypothetical protein DPMN_126506 [Dreissena polymorpha]
MTIIKPQGVADYFSYQQTKGNELLKADQNHQALESFDFGSVYSIDENQMTIALQRFVTAKVPV